MANLAFTDSPVFLFQSALTGSSMHMGPTAAQD